MILLAVWVVAPLAAYALWEPGSRITDGRHDLGHNGIWMQHGWFADDAWFVRNKKSPTSFHDPADLAASIRSFRSHHVTDLFVHVCPCELSGDLPPMNDDQVERFLDACSECRVFPWIGGVNGVQAMIDEPKWRSRFVASAAKLLARHPRLAGVHINIEPLPSGNADYLALLEALRSAIPPGKLISVAAYPPPTIWQRDSAIHWDEAYFRQVAGRSNQLAVMLYDTSLRSPKLYRKLVKDWTSESLSWAGKTKVLLGLPAYDDAGVGYHHTDVENLTNALRGAHAGLEAAPIPANYRGIAIYSEWEMNAAKWRELETEFQHP